jgi:hypothetical protein
MAENGLEESLTKDIGGIPVWAIGGGVGLLIAVAYWLHGRNSGGTVVAEQYDPNSATTTDDSTATNSDYGLPNGPAGDWLADNPGSAAFPVGGAALPTPISNAQWAKQVIDALIGLGDDPSLVTNAVTKYLANQPVSTAEKSIIDVGLQKFGSPPEGSIAIVPTSGDLPGITGLKAASATTSSLTFTWSYTGGTPNFLVVYLNGHPYNFIGGSNKQYVFKGLRSKTSYTVMIRPQKGGSFGASGSATGSTK